MILVRIMAHVLGVQGRGLASGVHSEQFKLLAIEGLKVWVDCEAKTLFDIGGGMPAKPNSASHSRVLDACVRYILSKRRWLALGLRLAPPI